MELEQLIMPATSPSKIHCLLWHMDILKFSSTLCSSKHILVISKTCFNRLPADSVPYHGGGAPDLFLTYFHVPHQDLEKFLSQKSYLESGAVCSRMEKYENAVVIFVMWASVRSFTKNIRRSQSVILKCK